MNILICDDEQATVEILEKFLTKRGHRVKAVSQGKDVISEIKNGKVDLLFLDIMLLGESGFDVLKQLKAIESDICVVMLTGIVVREEEAKDLDVYEYLYKPIDLDKIVWILKKVEDQHNI